MTTRAIQTLRDKFNIRKITNIMNWWSNYSKQKIEKRLKWKNFRIDCEEKKKKEIFNSWKKFKTDRKIEKSRILVVANSNNNAVLRHSFEHWRNLAIEVLKEKKTRNFYENILKPKVFRAWIQLTRKRVS